MSTDESDHEIDQEDDEDGIGEYMVRKDPCSDCGVLFLQHVYLGFNALKACHLLIVGIAHVYDGENCRKK